MDVPTIAIGFEFDEFLKSHCEKGGDVDSLLREKEFLEFKKAVQDACLKSASSPSYFIMTINMNSSESGVTEKRRRFVSIILRSFFSSIIFCQETPDRFEPEVVAKCGTSGYDYVKNGKESAVIWLKEDFDGETEGLKTTDTWITELRDSLGSDASELLSRIAMVKLTSKASRESVLAVSWHGPQRKLKKKIKMGTFISLTTFLDEVTKKKGIPSYIIGGDFNLNLLSPDIELPYHVAVASYELSRRQEDKWQKRPAYIPFKDTFVLYPGIKKLIVRYVRPLRLFEDKEPAASDLSKDDQAKVKGEMAEATDTPPLPTAMLDHDPIISVLQFSSSTVVRSLSEVLERVALTDA